MGDWFKRLRVGDTFEIQETLVVHKCLINNSCQRLLLFLNKTCLYKCIIIILLLTFFCKALRLDEQVYLLEPCMCLTVGTQITCVTSILSDAFVVVAALLPNCCYCYTCGICCSLDVDILAASVCYYSCCSLQQISEITLNMKVKELNSSIHTLFKAV